MSQLEDINAINDMFVRTTPVNAASKAIKASWVSWWGKLRPYDKSDSKATYTEATKRRDAFFKAENTGPDKPVAKPAAAPVKVSDTPILVPGPRPTLRSGVHKTNPSYKPYIVEWQNVIKVTPDGQFGPDTHNKTVAWQRARGLDADGVVGPKTWSQAQLESSKAMMTNTSVPAAAAAAVDQLAAAATAAQQASAKQPTAGGKAAAATAAATQSILTSAAQAANAAAGKAPAPTVKPPAPKPPAATVKPPVVPPVVTETINTGIARINSISAGTPVWMKAVAASGGVLAALIGFKVFSGKKRAA